MEPNQTQIKSHGSAKDFFLNLGAMVGLYTVVIALINLLFTVINSAFPKITNTYQFWTGSISFPVATLIIFFPIFVFLMWFMEKGYYVEPEKRKIAFRRWLTYITLFIAGVVLAADLVTVLYYFIDGQEMTVGFLMKILAVLLVSLAVFVYYVSDLRMRLTSKSRTIWFVVVSLFIIVSIVWGFVVLGSPRTQRLYKYDDQKVSALQEINYQITYYWQTKNVLPSSLKDLSSGNNYYIPQIDPQDNSEYEYIKSGDLSYQVCAKFNKPSRGMENVESVPLVSKGTSWNHPEGRYCFTQTINPSLYKGI